MIAGETVSKVDLMPFSDTYTFTYTFVPLQLGILELPHFGISRKPPSTLKQGQFDEKQLYLL